MHVTTLNSFSFICFRSECLSTSIYEVSHRVQCVQHHQGLFRNGWLCGNAKMKERKRKRDNQGKSEKKRERASEFAATVAIDFDEISSVCNQLYRFLGHVRRAILLIFFLTRTRSITSVRNDTGASNENESKGYLRMLCEKKKIDEARKRERWAREQ